MLSPRRILRIQIWLSLIATAVVITGVVFSYHLDAFKRADNFLYDLRIKWRGPMETSGQVVLVLMDEISARELNRHKGTWSRRDLSQAMENLCQAGAEIIGLDMVLSAPDLQPQNDKILASTIARCNNVVLARVSATHHESGVEPLEVFQEGMIGDGFIDVPLDEDEILRRIRYLNAKPLPDGNLHLIPAFALELARTFLNIDYTFNFATDDHLEIGAEGGDKLLLPYPELLINFFGNYKAFHYLSYADAVQNRFDPQVVKGKIVIIGSSLATQKDFFSTPFTRFTDLSKQYQDKFGDIIGGVLGAKEVGVACHAHAVETILSGAFIRQVSKKHVVLITILIGLLGAVFYLPHLGFVIETLGLAVGLAAILGFGHLLFVSRQVWVDIAPSMCVLALQFVAGVILQKAFDRKKTAMVTGLFGRYVSPGVVEELLKGDISTSLEGRRQELTILFSDLRNFTSLAEALGAKGTSDLLNVYFDAMIPIVFKNQGTLDKLIGDAIMAFFGAPVPVTDHPDQAAEAALQMIAKIEELKQTKISGCERLEAGIGLNTGSVTIGNLGSSAFMDYTIIGDAVNLASRLEGLNKIYGTHILVSAFTAQQLDRRFLLRELDLVQVKGKDQAVALYELMGWKTQLRPSYGEAADLFKSGLHAYRRQEWDRARRYFSDTLTLLPGDGPSGLYLQRIQQLEISSPGETWKGVTVFDHK